MEDFRFSLPKKEHHRNGGKHWFARNIEVEKYVLDKIKSEGPLKSKDFVGVENHKSLWYNWKPAKIALTNLFMDGSIMILNREGFQKIYDITERVLPNSVITDTPSTNEYCKHILNNAIKSHGLVTLSEIIYRRTGIKSYIKIAIDELIENNEIIKVNIERIDNTYYSTLEKLELLNNKEVKSNEIHILNPFDNLLIQRKRVKELFNFDYQVECYVPNKKRVFGYYTLPVLYGDKFVLRFDAKANRNTGVFTINGHWYENGFKPSEKFINLLNIKLKEFAIFCGCNSVNKFFKMKK